MKTDSFVIGVRVAQREGTQLSPSVLAKHLVAALHDLTGQSFFVEAEVIVGGEDPVPMQGALSEKAQANVIPFPGRRITETPVNAFEPGRVAGRGAARGLRDIG